MQNLDPQIKKPRNIRLKVILPVFIIVALGGIGLFHFWPKHIQKPLDKSDSLLLTNSLSTAFYIGRSSAVALKTPVTICAIDINTNTCIVSNNWSKGWQIYLPATNKVIRSFKPTFPDAIYASPSIVSPTFAPDGSLEGGPYTFIVAPKGCSEKYTLTISSSGELQTEKGLCH